MCAINTTRQPNNSLAELDTKVYEYLDKLIVLFPDFEKFQIHEYFHLLEPDLEKCKKIRSITSNIRVALTKLGYIENEDGFNNCFVLTEKGIESKKAGGHFKYLRKEKRRNFTRTYLSNIIAICAILLSAAVAYLNWHDSKKNDTIRRDVEKLKIEINTLKNLKKDEI